MSRHFASGSDALLVVLFVIALFVISIFWFGWLVMLLFGLLHSIWPAVPAIGYWTSVFLGFLVSAVTSGVRLTVKS